MKNDFATKISLLSHLFVVKKALLILLLILLATPAVQAGSRAFAYTYEVTTQPKGALEYEQWTTWKADKNSDRSFDRLDFRHELEYGVTDNWQVAFYVSDWRYETGKSTSTDGARWRGMAIETIYKLSDPTADALGTALYGEVKFGPDLMALEGKVLLQKNIYKMIIAYNAVIEAEWETGDNASRKGVLQQTFALSYNVMPSFSFGGEFLHEVEFAQWAETGLNVLYLGPTVSYRSKRGWWATMTTLWQVSEVASEPNIQTRLLVGIDF